MANKALGRDLRHLLARARPARIVERAAASLLKPGTVATPAGPGTNPHPPEPMELPLGLGASGGPESVVPVIPGAAVARLPVASAPAPALPSVPAQPVTRATAMSPWFVALLAADVVFLVVAVALVFGHWVGRPLAWYLAGAAVVAGAACGSMAFVVRSRDRAAHACGQASSGVRVQLRRL